MPLLIFTIFVWEIQLSVKLIEIYIFWKSKMAAGRATEFYLLGILRKRPYPRSTKRRGEGTGRENPWRGWVREGRDVETSEKRRRKSHPYWHIILKFCSRSPRNSSLENAYLPPLLVVISIMHCAVMVFSVAWLAYLSPGPDFQTCTVCMCVCPAHDRDPGINHGFRASRYTSRSWWVEKGMV